VLRELRQVAERDPWAIKSSSLARPICAPIDDLRKMYGPHDDELDLPMDMQVGFIGVISTSAWFRQRINEAETEIGGNHAPLRL
jgi:alpha-glucosidase